MRIIHDFLEPFLSQLNLICTMQMVLGKIYSQTSIYVLLYIRTFDLRTNFSERLTLYTYLKFDIRTSLNILKFDICTIQSMHKKYWSTYIKVQRPHRVTWGLWGIGSSGLKLSITSNSLGMLE
jgi:hypothetical protein